MVFSDCHVKLLTQSGVKTLNDPEAGIHLVSGVTVSDGISVLPSGTVRLPLRNPSDNKPWKSFVEPGDLCTIEFLAHTPDRKGWWLAIHGPIRTLRERTVISDKGAENVCELEVGSMTDILAADTVAPWMFLGSIYGVDAVRTRLTADESNGRPYQVAYNWLKKVAFDASSYNYSTDLGGWLSLDFGGLEANVVGTYKLSLAEGPHMETIGQFLDAPFHELYTTVGTPGEFRGDVTHSAGSAPGVKEPGAATILRWRAAPYPFCPLGGGSNTSEWDALPLHKLTDVQLVGERGAAYSLQGERNFFIAYPGYDVFSEWFAYTRAVAVVNQESVRRLGYRPLKTQTSLLINDETTESDMMTFSEELAWRLAGQHNNVRKYEYGTVTLPLSPWIKSGDRVECLSPWQSSQTYQYHVGGRQLTWDAASGGRMVLQLQRGYDVTRGPGFHAEGLARAEIKGAAEVSASFRDHDQPGV